MVISNKMKLSKIVMIDCVINDYALKYIFFLMRMSVDYSNIYIAKISKIKIPDKSLSSVNEYKAGILYNGFSRDKVSTIFTNYVNYTYHILDNMF